MNTQVLTNPSTPAAGDPGRAWMHDFRLDGVALNPEYAGSGTVSAADVHWALQHGLAREILTDLAVAEARIAFLTDGTNQPITWDVLVDLLRRLDVADTEEVSAWVRFRRTLAFVAKCLKHRHQLASQERQLRAQTRKLPG